MKEPMQPMMHTRDLQGSIAFYRDTLGFGVDATWPLDGEPTWAALSHGAAHFMITTADTEPALTGRLYFYPHDVDEYFADVSSRGARVIRGPETMEYGMYEFSLEDPNGYLLSFGQPAEGT